MADVFDALVSERPYKTAWPLERAGLPGGLARGGAVPAPVGRLDAGDAIRVPTRPELGAIAELLPPTTVGLRGRTAALPEVA